MINILLESVITLQPFNENHSADFVKDAALPSELHVATRYYMSVHVMTDDAEYWHLHLQAFTRHLKTKKKREHKQLQLTCKKNTRNNMYLPGPLTCNFFLIMCFYA